VINNSWVHFNEIRFCRASKYIGSSLSYMSDVFINLVFGFNIESSYCTLDEGFVWEHVVSKSTCELSNGKDKVFLIVHASCFYIIKGDYHLGSSCNYIIAEMW